ncbi:MAG: glycogen-binding domain-containing protein [Gemmatimonadaceae bacterium]
MIARASALALLAAVHAAGAQSTREVRFDAGAAQVQQTGRSARDAAGVFGLNWGMGTPRYATMLAAAITSAGDSASAAQAGLAAAWRPSEDSRWQTEGGTVVAAFGSSPLSRGGSFSGNLRERRTLGAAGVWVGGAFGGTSRDGRGSHSTAVELGASWRVGDFEATASATRLHSDDVSLFNAAELFVPDGSSYAITDFLGEVRYEHGPILLDATETARSAVHGTPSRQAAFFVTAVWTITPRYSFAVGTGRQLADPVRGVPDVQITSATLRISLLPARAIARAAELRGISFATVTQKSHGALLTVSVIADDTSLVEVAGSFSNWEPVQLTRTSEGWEAEIALPPGRHRVAVRIDDGPWRAPRGTARVKDEFGGEAGLIVVP